MSGWTCGGCGQSSPAGTRFCGHCGAPAAQTAAAASWSCRECGTSNPETNAFCGGCGSRAQPTRAEELRLVTALFADISGFTTLADTLDTEALHEVITPLVAGLTRIAERYEGFVEKFAGDALLVVYGAPVTHEDDAQRALLAALDMHAELPRMLAQIGPHAAHLTVHIGVNTGRVIARQAGSEQQSDYAVLGDSVILAQRLESVCPPGETYVGPTTYDLCKDEFAFEAVGELTLKGKLKPVHAFRLLGRRGASQSASPLVGRTRELAAAEEGLAAAAATVLVGEPGAGKTRLLFEIRRRAEARGARWLSARCLSYGAGLAYWPVADLLRQELGLRPTDSPQEVARQLPRLLPPAAVHGASRLLGLAVGGDPGTARREVHDAVLSWLAQQTEQGPVVLSLEDVHWADRSTVELLAEVLRTGVDLRVLLTARDEGVATAAAVAGEGALQLTRLGPLDAVAVSRMAEDLLGNAAAEGLVDLLATQSSGNALHVRELTRALSETGALVLTVQGWDVRPGYDRTAVPTTVERVFASRLDALPPAAARVLQLASVVGRTARLTLLRAVESEGDVDAALPILTAAGMLEPAGDSGEQAVTFSHALLQEVAYERLLRKRRRELHRRVAHVARELYGEGDDTIGLLARHLFLGEAGEEAVQPLLRAGHHAAGLYANDEAVLHLERALHVLEELQAGDRMSPVVLALAELQERRGDYPSALELYRRGMSIGGAAQAAAGAASVLSKTGAYDEALALLDIHLQQPDAPAPLWLARARVAFAACRPSEALTALRRGLHTAGVDDEALRSELLMELVRNENEVGHPEFAVAHGKRAITLLERRGDAVLLAQALRLVGDAQRKLGALEDAAGTLTRAIQLAQKTGHLEEAAAALVNLGMVQRNRGDIDDAILVTRRALSIAERLGHTSGRSSCLVNIADLEMQAGRLDEALASAHTALEFAGRVGHARTTTVATVTLAEVHHRRGEHDQARGYAERAVELAEALSAPEYADLAREVLAQAAQP